MLAEGAVIVGKWNNHTYRIKRLLGKGANGVVYLVRNAQSQELGALKIGYDALDLQSEINVLTSLAAHPPKRFRRMLPEASRPFLLDVDDCALEGMDVQFYVMRYIEGFSLLEYMEKNGIEWLGLVGARLLQSIQELHGAKLVFGDVKPENIIVTPHGEVELVDYGGVSQVGRSVKQFTEWYDRGYWNAGSRVAELGYDLFAIAIVWLQVTDGQRLRQLAQSKVPQLREADDLYQLVQSNTILKPLEQWFEKALYGQFISTQEACVLWRQLAISAGGRIQRAKKREETPDWLTGVFIVSILLLCSTIVYVLN